MNLDLKKIFDSTPRVVDIAISVSLSSLALGFAMAITLGDKVQLGENFLKVERQAIVNHKELEKSLLIIEIQKTVIEILREDTKNFSRQYKVGKELAEQAEHATQVIPEKQIEELRENLGESRLVLEGYSSDQKL